MWSTVVAHKAPTVVSEGRQGIAEQRRGEESRGGEKMKSIQRIGECCS